MTTTARSRQRTRYRGVVYGIDVLDHVTGRLMPNDYVGQTRQRGRGRENQHRDDQPWSDLIVGSPRVLWEGVCTDAELDEMERRFIQDVPVRPRLNWQLNEDNPQHIPKWVLVEQRHERDDRAGRPRWVPAKQRQRDSLLEWVERPGQGVSRRSSSSESRPSSSVRKKPRRKRLPARQRRLVGWTMAWLVFALSAWIGLAVADAGGWQQTGVTAGVGSAALLAWLRHVAHKVRRWLR